jgi:penicillin amidase
MAQDRMWQMDLLGVFTSGRLSEIFGKDMVDTDVLMRALRMPQKSRFVIAQTDKKVITHLEAFADGVNQYLEQHKNNLPLNLKF